MTDYKDEIIKKAEEEKAGLQAAINKSIDAIADRKHLNWLDTVNISRWGKSIKEIYKTINALKK